MQANESSNPFLSLFQNHSTLDSTIVTRGRYRKTTQATTAETQLARLVTIRPEAISQLLSSTILLVQLQLLSFLRSGSRLLQRRFCSFLPKPKLRMPIHWQQLQVRLLQHPHPSKTILSQISEWRECHQQVSTCSSRQALLVRFLDFAKRIHIDVSSWNVNRSLRCLSDVQNAPSAHDRQQIQNSAENLSNAQCSTTTCYGLE